MNGDHVSGPSERWREVWRLEFMQWRYLLMSLVLLPLIDVSLQRVGYKRTLLWLSRHVEPARANINSFDSTDVALKIARMVSLAGRRSPWRTTCLRQALALWFLLALRGVATELRLGVEKSIEGDFAAHAWVEHDGRVLIGGEFVQQRYVVLN